MRVRARALRSVVWALIVAAAGPAPAAAIDHGDVIVADPSADGGSGALIRVDSANGRQSLISSNAVSAANLFADPTAVALDRDGTLVVADREAFGGPGGLIGVDPDSGQQFGVASNLGPGPDLFADPSGVAVSASGRIYVTDQNAFGGSGGVIGVDPGSGEQFAVASNATSQLNLFDDPFGIAIEAGGDLAIADLNSPPGGSGGAGAIVGVDLETGEEFLISSNGISSAGLLADPYALAPEANGNLLVANDSPDPGARGVVRVSRFSGQQSALSPGGFFALPAGIGVGADAQALVADANAFGAGGGVIRVDPDSGGQSTLTNNFVSPPGMLVDPSGILIVPPRCRGEFATAVGSDGDDTIIGGPSADVIVTGGGDDVVEGKGGADLICGGAGRNRLVGDGGNDRFTGGAGTDVVIGDGGNDVINGQLGADKVNGGGGRDKLTGSGGNDALTGAGGADRLFGNRGRDRLGGGRGADLLSGGAGPDRLRGGPGEDRLRGGSGRDQLLQ